MGNISCKPAHKQLLHTLNHLPMGTQTRSSQSLPTMEDKVLKLINNRENNYKHGKTYLSFDFNSFVFIWCLHFNASFVILVSKGKHMVYTNYFAPHTYVSQGEK